MYSVFCICDNMCSVSSVTGCLIPPHTLIVLAPKAKGVHVCNTHLSGGVHTHTVGTKKGVSRRTSRNSYEGGNTPFRREKKKEKT